MLLLRSRGRGKCSTPDDEWEGPVFIPEGHTRTHLLHAKLVSYNSRGILNYFFFQSRKFIRMAVGPFPPVLLSVCEQEGEKQAGLPRPPTSRARCLVEHPHAKTKREMKEIITFSIG